MKKTLLVTSLLALAVFSGCSTKYYEKCNTKSGICEKNLTTNSVSVARDLVNGKTPCEEATCAPKKAADQKLNINIIVRQQPSSEPCSVNNNTPVGSNVDNF